MKLREGSLTALLVVHSCHIPQPTVAAPPHRRQAPGASVGGEEPASTVTRPHTARTFIPADLSVPQVLKARDQTIYMYLSNFYLAQLVVSLFLCSLLCCVMYDGVLAINQCLQSAIMAAA